jgi:hypothetical protein
MLDVSKVKVEKDESELSKISESGIAWPFNTFDSQ